MSEKPPEIKGLDGLFKEAFNAELAAREKAATTLPTPPSNNPIPEPAPAKAEEQSPDNGKDKTEAATPKDDAPKPYTAEELRKLTEEHGAEAAHLIEEKRLEGELAEKKKAMDAMFTKERQAFSEKEKQLQDVFKQAQESLEVINKQREKYKEMMGEEPEEDPKIKELNERLTRTEIEANWRTSQDEVRQVFPDYGLYDDEDMISTLQQYPIFKELAMEKNGKYGVIVLAAAHFLTQRKPENFAKLVEAELEENPDAYKAILSKHVKAKLEKLEQETLKKEGLSKAKSEPVEKAVETKPETKRRPGDLGGMLADEMQSIMSDPEKLKEAMAKRR